ncbi:MAG: DUF2127 domain-containing protein [Paracoccaceae bacterium]
MSAPKQGRGKPLLDRLLHQIFEASLFLKGFFAVLEFAGGVALYSVGNDWILALVQRLTLNELISDPNDAIALTLLNFAQNFSVESKDFYGLYLATHGIVKLVLVGGLVARIRWAYPAAIATLFLFIAYQLYRYYITASFGLVIISGFDVILIALIRREYMVMRREPAG